MESMKIATGMYSSILEDCERRSQHSIRSSYAGYRGFTIIELLITITIISILTSIALPSYQSYLRKAHYTEIVQAAAPYKLAIDGCFQEHSNLTNCTAEKGDIPPNIINDSTHGLIANITVSENGKITITPKDKHGIKPTDTFILTPTINHERLIWTHSGGGVKKGYAR